MSVANQGATRVKGLFPPRRWLRRRSVSDVVLDRRSRAQVHVVCGRPENIRLGSGVCWARDHRAPSFHSRNSASMSRLPRSRGGHFSERWRSPGERHPSMSSSFGLQSPDKESLLRPPPGIATMFSLSAELCTRCATIGVRASSSHRLPSLRLLAGNLTLSPKYNDGPVA